MKRSPKSAGANFEVGIDSDMEIVDGLIAGDAESFSIAMCRYNQRLFRVARAVLFDDAEAEDVVQETWLRTFRSIASFERRSTFATWISRIALYEAWSRARRRTRRAESIRDLAPPPASDDPEAIAFGHEVRQHLGVCVDELPERYRLVFMLREIDGSSTEETALCLGISTPAVKVRLHRARAMLRRRLGRDAGETEARAYRFGVNGATGPWRRSSRPSSSPARRLSEAREQFRSSTGTPAPAPLLPHLGANDGSEIQQIRTVPKTAHGKSGLER